MKSPYHAALADAIDIAVHRNGKPPDLQRPLDPLKARLHKSKFVQLMKRFEERYPGAHLKLLVADEVTDRRRMRIAGQELWNFGCDSFLGLDRHPRVQGAIRDALPRWGSHNGASRAFCGVALAEEAERRLARWLGVADTLIFPSVSLANLGLLPALATRGTLLAVDRIAHESVQEGAQLAAGGRGVTLRELHPCTGDSLQRLLEEEAPETCLAATDGVYSMSGLLPPLAELDRTARAYGGMLYVDDAHGTGLVGPRGRGATAAALPSLAGTLVVGSLSKAFSCLGGFVTCDPELKLYLQMTAGTFIFGGPVPPPYLAAICAACDIIDSDEGDALRKRVRGLTARLVSGIQRLGLVVQGGGESHIVTVKIGEIGEALRAARWLFDHGFYVQSAHYPAVSPWDSRLRIQVNANHPDEAIDALLNALEDLANEAELPREKFAERAVAVPLP